MPPKPYRDTRMTPTERLEAGVRKATIGDTQRIYESELDSQVKFTGYELAGAMFASDSVVGSLFNRTFDGPVADNYAADGFDPYEYASEEFLQQHPYMVEPFMSGRVDAIRNPDRFSDFMDKARLDAEMREISGRSSFVAQLGAALPGQVVDALSLYVVAGGAGAASQMSRHRAVHEAGKRIAGAPSSLDKWLKAGTIKQRVGKGMAVGAGANLAQEAGLEAVNPDRNVDELTAGLMAVGMGAVFGATLPALGSGARRTAGGAADMWDSAGIKRARTRVNTLFNRVRENGELDGARQIEEVQVQTLLDAERDLEMAARQGDGDLGAAVEAPDNLDDAFKFDAPSPTSTAGRGTGKLKAKYGLQDIGESLRAILEPHGLWLFPHEGKRARPKRTQIARESFSPSDPEEGGFVHYMAEAADRETAGDLRGGIEGINTSRAEVGMGWRLGQHRAVVVAADEHTITIEMEHGVMLPGLDGSESFIVKMNRDRTLPVTKGTVEMVGQKPINYEGPSTFPADRPASVGAAGQSVNEIPVPGRRIAVMRTARTQPIIDRIEKRFGKNTVEIVEDGDLSEVKDILELEELDEAFQGLDNASLGPFRDAFVDLLAGAKVTVPGTGGKSFHLLPGEFRAAGDQLTFSPIGAIRDFSRELFAIARPTEGSKANPITTQTNVPAEILKTVYEGWHARASLDVESIRVEAARSGKPIVYDFGGDVADSSHTHSRGEQTIGGKGKLRFNHGDKVRFNRAVADYMRRTDAFERGQHKFEPEAPQPIKDAAEAVREYFEKMGQDAVDVGLIDPDLMGALNVTGRPRLYLPRKWVPEAISRNQETFKALILRQWRANREADFDTSKAITAAEREIDADVIGSTSKNQKVEGVGLTATQRKQIKAFLDAHEGDKAPTEAELAEAMGDSFLDAYLQEVEIYLDESADRLISTLANPMFEGAEIALPSGSIFSKRVLEVNEEDFTEFLEQDISLIMGAYQRQAAGKIAVRRAIKNNIEKWAPFVKAMTGDNLVNNHYDPDLILKAIAQSNTRAMKAASGLKDKAGRDAMQNTIQKAGAKGTRILERKMHELEGRPIFGDNAAAMTGWRLMLARTAPRLPYMAMMGMMTISAIPDIAAFTFRKEFTPHRTLQLRNAIMLHKEMPTRYLETQAAALNDIMHSIRAHELADIGHAPASGQFGPGRSGRVYEGIDRTTDLMSRKMAQWSGMNRWNTNMKRLMSYHIMQDMISNARKMHKAQELIDGGVKEADAIRRAGLSEEAAMRMNRLGVDGKRAGRLLDKIDRYGVDWEGNRVGRNHKGFISPEYSRWMNEDRELFDVFTGAINTEVTNFIVEPNLLSRPLINQHLLGRLFNQFQSFAFAWGNQAAPVIAQHPVKELIQYALLSVALGGVASAVHNQLSGRRDFDDTAKAWTTKPYGEIVDAIYRSSLVGWLARPLGIAEKTPLGPARMMGNEFVTTQSSRALRPSDQFGPLVSWLNNTSATVERAAFKGEWNTKTARQMYSSLPYQNLWIIRAWHRAIEAAGLEDNWLLHPGPEPYRLEDLR
jgi:hypothetical protein